MMQQDFVTAEDLSLFTTGTRFVVASVFLKEGMEGMIATFDLLVRELPKNRNYLVFAGLPYILDYLRNLRFDRQQLAWLQQSYHFDKKTLNYFRNFRFTGDVWAMPEGTIFFPNEPIVRITAPLVEAQAIEMYLINAAYFPTIFASKLSRYLHVANGKPTPIAYNRSYGAETALKAERIKEMLRGSGGLALYSYRSGTPTFSTGTYHYLISAFPREIDAFRSYLRLMKGKGYVVVDTYNTIEGIKNFIRVARELNAEGITVTGVQIDSGDHEHFSRIARKMLDAAGLKGAKIFAMGNLDEWKVDRLEKNKAPIDVYAGGTELLTPSDAPTMELVYKLSELRKGKTVIPKMKTSPNKVSLPGRKQVYRITRRGKYVGDVIGLEGERGLGKPFLQQMIKNGKLVYKPPKLADITRYYQKEKRRFDKEMFSVWKEYSYPVKVSAKLQRLIKVTRKAIRS